MRADPVTPDLHDEVLRADRYRCVARVVCEISGQPLDPCGGRWHGQDSFAERLPAAYLTLDHVKDQPRMGRRAPSDRQHLVSLCWHHHLDGWATAHRPELRAYLTLREGA
jgi:hypothetical protein